MYETQTLTSFVKQNENDFMPFEDFSTIPDLVSKYTHHLVKQIKIFRPSGDPEVMIIDFRETEMSSIVSLICVDEFNTAANKLQECINNIFGVLSYAALYPIYVYNGTNGISNMSQENRGSWLLLFVLNSL